MPQPQPNPPDVMRIIGLCLTVICVISVLLVFLGLACNVAHIMIDMRKLTLKQHEVISVACTRMLSFWIVGLFAFLIKGFLRYVVSESRRVFKK